MPDSINIGGEGGNAFPFNTPGDQVTGQIIDLNEVQQTDLQTGQPKFFDSGQPMMMFRVTLQTQLRDPQNPADDGKRSVFLKGSRKPESQSSLAAVVAACQQATGGTTDLTVGGTLTLQYRGDGQPAQRGFSPPKLYAAAYTPRAVNLAPPSHAGPVQPPQGQPDPWAGAPAWAAPPQQPVQQQVAPPPQAIAPPQPPIAQPVAPVQPIQAAPAQQPQLVDQATQLAALQGLGITPEQLAAAVAQQQAAQQQPVAAATG